MCSYSVLQKGWNFSHWQQSYVEYLVSKGFFEENFPAADKMHDEIVAVAAVVEEEGSKVEDAVKEELKQLVLITGLLASLLEVGK